MNVEQAITHLKYKDVTNKKRFTEAINALENEINIQKAENEMLKDLITYQKQEIKEKEQKYNQAVDDMFGLIETTRNEIAEVKSKAIKEFAERLKEKRDGGTYPYVLINVIDNLVKEMTEPVKLEHNSL